jgi:hypothetical protein
LIVFFVRLRALRAFVVKAEFHPVCSRLRSRTIHASYGEARRSATGAKAAALFVVRGSWFVAFVRLRALRAFVVKAEFHPACSGLVVVVFFVRLRVLRAFVVNAPVLRGQGRPV